MNMKFPKMAIGEAWPNDEYCWAVRLRNPLMMALVEERGLVSFHLFCWPESVVREVPPGKLAKAVSRLAEYWGREVEYLDGLPSQWGYSFDARHTPPRWMLLDDEASDWTGILDTTGPHLYHLVEDGPTKLTRIVWDEEFGGDVGKVDVRAAAEYYQKYRELENQLPEEEC